MKLKSVQPVILRLPPFQRVYITLCGCGGTGSHLASGLATLALALKEKDVQAGLVFIDPDDVEPKNVGRQLFISHEVGKPKAAVLADRLYLAYNVVPSTYLRPFDGSFTTVWDNCLNVIIGAVDNAPARKLVAQAVERAKGQLWWLDCGNKNHSGQIALGNTVDPRRWKPALGMVDSLPAPHIVYPDLVKAPKKVKAVSCADAPEQSLMVNRMVAAWALSLLNDFLLGQLHYFTLDFDLAFGGTHSRTLDEATLKEI